MSAGSVLHVLGALAVTLALLALSLRLLKRMQAGTASSRGGVPLRMLQRIQVGPKQGVGLLQVGGRVLVVSIAENGTQLLAELDAPEAGQALCPERPPAAAGPGSPLRLLRRLALVAALAILPLPASAQTAVKAAPPRPAGVTVPAPATRAAAPAPAPALGVHPPAPPKVELRLGSGNDALQLSGTVGLVVFIGALTLLPAVFLLMTGFTRILIVLHFLRSALGTQTTPPNQLLIAMAVLLTGVVMNPVLQESNRVALQPYFQGQLTQVEAYTRGIRPFREFMLANTRDQEIALFTELSGATNVETEEDLPTLTVVSAFVTSELRAAFQMGFIIYLPFVVLDLVVASVLMSLGMFMLPPMMISLPFKLLLFVLADGWTLVVQNLVQSFR